MSIASLFLAVLLICLPLVAFAAGPGGQGALTLGTGAVLAFLGATMRPGETTHVQRLIRPLLLIAVLPAIWIGIQLLPIEGLAHPIWASAAGALGRSLPGRVTIDPGLTLLALWQYLLAVGLVVVTVAVTIDRQRAEWSLWALTVLTALMAVVVVVHDLAGLTFLGEIGRSTRAGFDTAAALGVVLASASADLAIERHETRRGKAGGSTAKLVERLSAALVAFGLCSFAVGYFLRDTLLSATGCGLATVLLVVALRRLGAGAVVGWGVGAIALIAAAMIVAGQRGAGDAPVSIRFAALPSSRLAAADRMLADASWTGTGAGTYTVLESAYRDIDAAALPSAPTLAAALTVELGLAAPWIAMVLAGVLVALLLRGALRRGRDSFYPAAAAGCLVVLTIAAFRDASLLGLGPMVLAALILGLGLAQRESRSMR